MKFFRFSPISEQKQKKVMEWIDFTKSLEPTIKTYEGQTLLQELTITDFCICRINKDD